MATLLLPLPGDWLRGLSLDRGALEVISPPGTSRAEGGEVSQRFWVVKSQDGYIHPKDMEATRLTAWHTFVQGNRLVQVELREVARDLNTSAIRPRAEETEKERACESA